MGKQNKRNSSGATSPVQVIPKKADPGLQSLMEYGDNLKEFVDICAHLPVELKADLRNVQRIEQTTYQLTKELSRDQAEILERAKAKYRQATRPEHLETLIDEAALQLSREKRRKVEECVSEKVAVTSRMYDALDSCIKHIDEEISKLEHDVEETYGVIPELTALAPELLEQAKQGELAAAEAGTATGEAQNRAADASGKGAAGGADAGSAVGGGRGQDVASLNEPLYCVCHRIGFGDMIGCDNEDCEHGEWFHIACVYLLKVDGSFTNADGETITFWLCPGCQADAREKQRRETLEMTKAASLRANAVKVPAVKLPEEGDEEEDDEEEEEGEGAGADKPGKAQDKPGDHKPGDTALSVAPSLPKEEAKVTPNSAGEGPGSQERGGMGGVPGNGAGTAPQSAAASGRNLPKEEEKAVSWQGLGGLGSNALPEGTGSGPAASAAAAVVVEAEKQKVGAGVGDGVRVGDVNRNDGQGAIGGNGTGIGGDGSSSATLLVVGACEGGDGGGAAGAVAEISGAPMVGGGESKGMATHGEQGATVAPADLGAEAGPGTVADVSDQGVGDAIDVV